MAADDILDSREAGGKVIRGGGLRAGSYVGGLAIGLISAPLLIGHLSVAQYGLFVTVQSIVFVVGGLTEGGLGNVAIREYANAVDSNRRALVRALLGLRLALVGVGTVIALAFTVIAGYREVVTIGVAIAAAGLLLGAAQHTYSVALQAKLQLGWLASLNLVQQVTTTTLIAILVLLGAALTPFFGVSVVALGATLVATWWAARHVVDLRPEIDRPRWTALMRETGLYALATSLGVLYFQVAIISVSLLASETQAGYYGAAFRIVDIANGVPWIVASSAFPILARAAARDSERLRYALQRLFEAGLACGGLFVVAITIGAPFAMDVLATGSDKLDPAIDVLRILAIGTPCTFLIATWSLALVSFQRYAALAVANGVAVLLAIVLSLLLIPDEGALGAAVTTAVLEVVLAAGYGVALVRADTSLRPSLAVVPRVALAVAVGLSVPFLLGLPSVPATILGVGLYLAVVLITRALPPEIGAAVRERLPGTTSSGQGRRTG